MPAIERSLEGVGNPVNGWKRYSVWIYVALAYAITWALWLPVEAVASQRGYILPDPSTLSELSKTGFKDGTHLLLSIISMLTAGPLFAAIIILSFESGKAGLRDLWQRSTHWRVGGKWYLIMLAILFVIYLPAVILGIVKGPVPTASQLLTPLAWFVPMFLYTLVASGLEEPGWRGYALPKLQTRFNAKKASLILGVIWGIWHWPVFIAVYTNALSAPGGSAPQAFFTTLVQLLIYIFGALLPEAFIYTWLYNRTRSVFLCILFHVFHNMAATYAGMLLPAVASVIPVLGGIVQWVIAIVLMRFFWVEATYENMKGESK
jgi:CAAX protease family protein